LIQLGGAIAGGVIAQQLLIFSEYSKLRKTSIVVGIWNVGSAVCDITIAASMTYYLARQRTAWKPTQQTVHKLMCLFIETGVFTAALAIINFVLFLIPNYQAYCQITVGMLANIYSITMMVVLNSRIVFKTQDESNKRLSEISRSAFASYGGILVTHEQWTVPSIAKELEVGSNAHAAPEM